MTMTECEREAAMDAILKSEYHEREAGLSESDDADTADSASCMSNLYASIGAYREAARLLGVEEQLAADLWAITSTSDMTRCTVRRWLRAIARDEANADWCPRSAYDRMAEYFGADARGWGAEIAVELTERRDWKGRKIPLSEIGHHRAGIMLRDLVQSWGWHESAASLAVKLFMDRGDDPFTRA